MDELDNIPVWPFSRLLTAIIRSSEHYGPMPDVGATLAEVYDVIQEKIRIANKDRLFARTAEEVTVIAGHLESLKEQESRILNAAKDAAVQRFLDRRCVCLGYLNGWKVVVPSPHFSGEVDWDNHSLRFGDHTYTRLQMVHLEELDAEQKNMIQRKTVLKEDPEGSESSDDEPISTGAPGRPSSMHLIEDEFQRRARQRLTAPTLGEESEFLANWLKRNHSKWPQPTPKTIKNNLRPEFRKVMHTKAQGPDRARYYFR